MDIFCAGGVVVACGIAGHLMAQSDKHAGTQINYLAAEPGVICTGTLRAAQNDGREFLFFDVLTALEPDDRLARQFEQGAAIAKAVLAYLEARSDDPRGYADAIPVLPFTRTDYVSRELAAMERRS